MLVGVNIDTSGATHKTKTKKQAISHIQTNLHHPSGAPSNAKKIEHKSQGRSGVTTQRQTKRGKDDEIFPLDEDDLKEF